MLVKVDKNRSNSNSSRSCPASTRPWDHDSRFPRSHNDWCLGISWFSAILVALSRHLHVEISVEMCVHVDQRRHEQDKF